MYEKYLLTELIVITCDHTYTTYNVINHIRFNTYVETFTGCIASTSKKQFPKTKQINSLQLIRKIIANISIT